MSDAHEPQGPGPDADATASSAPGDRPTDCIGPYKLLEKIGEGGMGEVWLAEQAQPVRRRVALKVIKAGMDTRQVVARFEAERQALALMDHPAIARVFDAGETPQGRPYFVMEHVQGVPLTEHCDRHRLSTEERIRLFMQVCDGVQHAHHKAIIHRDLKPSNVLVTMQEGKAAPKIIDFGVAKATAQRLTEKTMFTGLGVLIGTPEYMSPEQADLTAQDVDTRTDVYALGAMLYELLVGALPFDGRELRRAGFDEIRRRIREVEPSRPSARVSTLGAEATTASAHRRQVDPRTLRRQLAGDLDWITMKALEKDRERRYASPAELSADLGRHLAHEPVLAGPPSAAYRAGKFVRRHRFGVAAATVALVALVAFSAAMAVQVRRTTRERVRAERVSQFLTSLFTSADPMVTGGKEVSLREVLDRGAERTESELEDEPEVQAGLFNTIGNVYLWLGRYDEAERLLARALEMRRRLLGEDAPPTLVSMDLLGAVRSRQGRGEEAERLYRQALDGWRRVRGEDHPRTMVSMFNLAETVKNNGRTDEAEALFRELLDRQARVLGDDPALAGQRFMAMQALAQCLVQQGRHGEAMPLLRQVLEYRLRANGKDHPLTLNSTAVLAWALQRAGAQAEAETLAREALAGRRRVLGDVHPETLTSVSQLGGILADQRRDREAATLHLEALEGRRRTLGEEHPDTLWSFGAVVSTLHREGRLAEAEATALEQLAAQRRALGERSPDVAMTLYNLACFAALRGDRGKAIDRLTQAEAHGFRDAKLIAEDSDLASLRGDPAFERLRARIGSGQGPPGD